MDYIGVPEEAIRQYQRNGHRLLGAGAQAVSAGDMWALGSPGFAGLGLNHRPVPRHRPHAAVRPAARGRGVALADVAGRQLVAAAAARSTG